MKKLPFIRIENGKCYCKNIFSSDDIGLYYDTSMIDIQELNSFLPKGLYFDDKIRYRNKSNPHKYDIMYEIKIRKKLPDIINEHNQVIMELSSLSYGYPYREQSFYDIHFHISDKEKCEYILYCIINLIEYIKHKNEIAELDNIHRNNKSVKIDKLPKDFYNMKSKKLSIYLLLTIINIIIFGGFILL